MKEVKVTKDLKDITVHFQVLDLGRQTYAWVGTSDAAMRDLSLAFPPETGQQAATTLLGWSKDSPQETLARRLANLTKLPLAVSLNVPADPELLALIEKELRTLLQSESAEAS